jgi:hypothetical protein
VATTRLVVAGTLWCMAGIALAQSSPATTGSGQNPTAITRDAKAGVSASTPANDTSGNKSFFESRSNTARTPGEAKAVTPVSEVSAKKTFNESRSNNTRTPGDAKTVTSGTAASGNKSFFESRSNTAKRTEDTARTGTGTVAAPGNSPLTSVTPAQSAPK